MELLPQPLPDLLARCYAELQHNDSLFTLPRKKWYLPAPDSPDSPDLSVSLHGRRAGNPAGPAAGPHTQMAQNLLLSYLAGGRILELKTVQVNDRLTIPRPCIDMTTVGYNVEWSQELRIEQSLREYVAGMMLIETIRHDPTFAGTALQSSAGDYLFDMSVGYDLEGIRSPKVQHFLDSMRDASRIIDDLRATLPPHYKLARDLPYPTRLSTSITLSTFHGCPADQIEQICQFLLVDKDLDVIVKMNPPMLGKEHLEHLLYDVMGYTELTVAPHAYTSGLQFDESLELVDRLARLASSRNRHFGTKFSNTLEVLNHKTFFTPDQKTQYLSGQPLHVITMALTNTFRQALVTRDRSTRARAMGDSPMSSPPTPPSPHPPTSSPPPLSSLPVSFSAGIDRHNFPLATACGFTPASVCSDLLRPGGYARLPHYLHTLSAEMKKLGATTIPSYIRAFAKKHPSPSPTGNRELTTGNSTDLTSAAIHNTTICAELAKNDPRYRSPANRKPPNRVSSHLTTFDCLTCDKCLPVCPNAANFTYPTPLVSFTCQDVLLNPDGSFTLTPGRPFAITRTTQIANFADFCNDCGNCDTFCPEYGGPYIQKPNLFSSPHSYASSNRDGFYVTTSPTLKIIGRMQGLEYSLTVDVQGESDRPRSVPPGGTDIPVCDAESSGARTRAPETRHSVHLFTTPTAQLTFSPDTPTPLSARPLFPLPAPLQIDTWPYHTLRHLLHGLLSPTHIHQLNAPLLPTI